MPYYVQIIESERGWGQKVDDTLYFTSKVNADHFVREYNKQNNLPTAPDWYMMAEAPRECHELPLGKSYRI